MNSHTITANVTGWLQDLMLAQTKIPREWGCYLQCLPGLGVLWRFATWHLDCLYFGGDVAKAELAMAPVNSAFANHRASGSKWAVTPYSTFLEWKASDRNDKEPRGVAAILTSRILPADVFTTSNVPAVASAVLRGVKQGVNIQIAMLLGGEAGGAHSNAVSEWMRRGSWHVVGAGGWLPEEPERAQNAVISKVRGFGSELRRLVPDSGSYLNECDWLEPDWRSSLFRGSYERLLEVKNAVDPKGLLSCHQCVGSYTRRGG